MHFSSSLVLLFTLLATAVSASVNGIASPDEAPVARHLAARGRSVRSIIDTHGSRLKKKRATQAQQEYVKKMAALNKAWQADAMKSLEAGKEPSDFAAWSSTYAGSIATSLPSSSASGSDSSSVATASYNNVNVKNAIAENSSSASYSYDVSSASNTNSLGSTSKTASPSSTATAPVASVTSSASSKKAASSCKTRSKTKTGSKTKKTKTKTSKASATSSKASATSSSSASASVADNADQAYIADDSSSSSSSASAKKSSKTSSTTSSAASSSSSSSSSSSGSGLLAGVLDVVTGGEATFFEVGLGACGWTNSDSDYIVALSHNLWDQYGNAVCNKKIRVSNGSKTIDVTVVDECMVRGARFRTCFGNSEVEQS